MRTLKTPKKSPLLPKAAGPSNAWFALFEAEPPLVTTICVDVFGRSYLAVALDCTKCTESRPNRHDLYLRCLQGAGYILDVNGDFF